MFGLHVRSALHGLNFGSKQLYIVYLYGFLASGILNEVHSTAETVSTIDIVDGLPLTTSQDGAAGRLHPTVSLKTDMISLNQLSTHQTDNITTVIAATTSQSEEKEFHQSTHQTDNFTASSVTTSYEVDKFHQTPLATNITGESHESTHQTDDFTSSSTTTSQTTTDELDPTAELHMLDLTTAFDNLLNTSPTEEIGDSDSSPQKIPCTPRESDTVKCLNGGTCVAVQTSNTSRVRLCSCPFEYTGKRCEIRFVASFWKSKANVTGISAGVAGVGFIVVVLVVVLVCCWWRKRRRNSRNSMTDDAIWSDKQKKRKRQGFKPTEVLHLNSCSPAAANVNTSGEACASSTFLGGVNDRDYKDQDSRAV